MEKINETPQTRRESGLRERNTELDRLEKINRGVDETLYNLEAEYTK